MTTFVAQHTFRGCASSPQRIATAGPPLMGEWRSEHRGTEQGIIRRVTESVTGLFNSAWLPGWIRADEAEEDAGPSTASATTTTAPVGESFIFSQPTTSRKPFKLIYPEEGEVDDRGASTSGDVNVGASTSSSPPPISFAPVSPRVSPLVADTPGPSFHTRRSLISSTPAVNSSTITTAGPARTKSQLEARPLSLLTTSTPTGDDGSEGSEYSADTGVDASVVPRPDEREYQREILQLDEESLHTLRESLARPPPPPPTVNALLPSLEETLKRPRDSDIDQTSMRAHGSTASNRSLFSETGAASTSSQPQPSALASKRPRFNISTYGSPVLGDRSVLSDSAFKSSPFYPGKTTYGGASAYRRGRAYSRVSNVNRVQVKAKPAPEVQDDGGLSQAARRILDCLEKMSTPISDAKRIPTPTPGSRGSYLDGPLPFTLAFHKFRPSLRSTGPPASKLTTPVKANIQENIAKKLIEGNTSSSTSKTNIQSSPVVSKTNSPERTTKADSPERTTTTTTITSESSNKEEDKEAESLSEGASIFSKAAEEPLSKESVIEQTNPTTEVTTSAASDADKSIFMFGTAAASASTFTFSASSAATISSTKTTDVSSSWSATSSTKAGGKIKTKVTEIFRAPLKVEEKEPPEVPELSSGGLSLSSLPKIDLPIKAPPETVSVKFETVTEAKTSVLSPVTETPGIFRFSVPEVVESQVSEGTSLVSPPQFKFSAPAFVEKDSVKESEDSGGLVVKQALNFNSTSNTPAFVPKQKFGFGKEQSSDKGELKSGGLLDYLKANDSSNSVECKKSPENTNSNVPVTVNNSWGDKFKPASGSWECEVCMVRNDQGAMSCVSCETAKPGAKPEVKAVSNSLSSSTKAPVTTSVQGFGSVFKMASDEWECDTCMVRNKNADTKCVSCETPKPGSQSVTASSNVSSVSTFKFTASKDISQSTLSNTTTTSSFTFGVSEKKEDKVAPVFGGNFKKASGEWECDTCLIRNSASCSKCVACETPKLGSSVTSEAITGNFKFGVNSTSVSESSTSSGTGFKFGVAGSEGNSSIAPSSNTTTPKFGVSLGTANNQITSDTSSTPAPTFTFGVKPATDSVSEGSKEGKNGGEGEETEEKGIPTFTFGAPKTVDGTSKDKTETEVPNEVTSPNVNFNFGSSSSLSAKATPQSDPEDSSSGISATSTNPGSVIDVLKKPVDSKAEEKPSVPNFSFGAGISKNVSSETSSKPVFGNSSFTTKDSSADTTQTLFGNPKVSEKVTTVGGTVPTLSFGGGELKSSSAAVFQFGSKAAAEGESKAMPLFTFGNKTMESSGTKPSFPAFGKRDSGDGGEPTKKVALDNTVNNGVGSSLFSFGAKDKGSSGPAFGAPAAAAAAAAAPTLGAQAPASNSSEVFQFGNSNPPAAAAPAPTSSFGTPAPNFGSSGGFGSQTATSGSGYAFGQPAEKKPNTGFDFGQVANSAPNFNFTSPAAAPPQAPAQFQIGQSSSTSGGGGSGGLFMFGSSSSATTNATPFGSGDNSSSNPFSPAPPTNSPGGRVFRKAARRVRR